MREIVEAVAHGELEAQSLRSRPDCQVLRIQVDGESVIAKLWDRRSVRSLLRNLSRTSNRHREWRTLKRLFSRGMNVPRPLQQFHLSRSDSPFSDALVMQDMGDCVRGANALKTMLREGNEEERRRVEAEVIDMTHELVHGCRILDVDHHLNNIVLQPDGRVARLDFELARRAIVPGSFPQTYGRMVGLLVFSYLFTCQPQVELARGFSERLCDRLGLSSKLRGISDETVRRAVEGRRAYQEFAVDFQW